MRLVLLLLLVASALTAFTACSSTNPPENQTLFQEFRIFDDEDDNTPQKP